MVGQLSDEIRKKTKQSKLEGFPKIVFAKTTCIRLVWTLVYTVFTCLCVFLICDSIREYLRFHVTSTTRVINEQHSVFPTLTICQVNPFSTNDAALMMLQADNATNMIKLELHTKNTTGYYITDALKKSMSNDLDAILVECLIGQRRCSSSDFQWFWHPSMYNCYRFNARKEHLLKANIAGFINFRFEATLYAGLSDHWSRLVGTSGARGFFLLLHNITEYPFNDTPSPIVINPGFGLYASVERTFYRQYNAWPYSYSECHVDLNGELIGGKSVLEDSFLYDQVIATNYTYSRRTCVTLCAQLMTTK